MSWMFSKNRALTFVVVLRNKTGGPFEIGTNLVGSLYFMFSKLTLCMIRVSFDQKRVQLSRNPFWYKSKKEDKDQNSIQSSTTPDPGHHMRKLQNTRKHLTQNNQEASPFPQVTIRLQRTDKKA